MHCIVLKNIFIFATMSLKGTLVGNSVCPGCSGSHMEDTDRSLMVILVMFSLAMSQSIRLPLAKLLQKVYSG